MIFAKYANPMILLDTMIRNGRFNDFCTEFIRSHNQEMEDKTLWEYYLHRIYDQSFAEFKQSLASMDQKHVEKEQLEITIMESSSMLKGFVP